MEVHSRVLLLTENVPGDLRVVLLVLDDRGQRGALNHRNTTQEAWYTFRTSPLR
jgi:hypothetical protein